MWVVEKVQQWCLVFNVFPLKVFEWVMDVDRGRCGRCGLGWYSKVDIRNSGQKGNVIRARYGVHNLFCRSVFWMMRFTPEQVINPTAILFFCHWIWPVGMLSILFLCDWV